MSLYAITTMSSDLRGKRAVHNWSSLPSEVLRLVVANILAYKPEFCTPTAWLHQDFHYQRSIFETLRDAHDVQRIMRVCPQWHYALINIDFWQAACRKLDRLDIATRSLVNRDVKVEVVGSTTDNVETRLRRNFNHFHTLCQVCCIPCRINRPTSKEGICNVKTTLATAPFGQVSVCKGHRNNSFCGVCLKDVSIASHGDHNQLAKVPESLFENEDFDTWPTVHTTCFHCRRDALLRIAALYSNPSVNLLDFIGGSTLNGKDYEARSTVDNFVDMAEGGVNDVITVVLERQWLRVNTNLGSLLDQAVASARYSRAEMEDYESEEEMLSDDEEDTYDMLQSQEENGVRTLAITAWARARILDGNWVTPADIWCMNTGQVPVDSTWDPSLLTPTVHPVPYSLQTSPSNNSVSIENEDVMSTEPSPPTHQMIHYPPLDIHTTMPSYRFAQITANHFRATFRDIIFEPLRSIVLRIMNEAQVAAQDPCVRLAKLDIDDVLVLLRDELTWHVDSGNGTRLTHAIPYIPATTQNMAPMTRNLLEALWKEACAPLFQCQCSICDRAIQKQVQSHGIQAPSQPIAIHPNPVVAPMQTAPRQIILVETESIPTSEPVLDAEPLSPIAVTPVSDAGSVRSRKRSSAELDSPQMLPSLPQGHPQTEESPRKRQRTSEIVEGSDDVAMTSEPESPIESDSRDATAPGSPAASTGVSSEAGLSSSSASDSSSLQSVANGVPLTALANPDKSRKTNVSTASTKMMSDTVKIHGEDDTLMCSQESPTIFFT